MSDLHPTILVDVVFAAIVVMGVQPLGFPVEPIREEVVAGVQSAVRHQSLSTLYGRDRLAVGYWFDGTRRKPAEYILWLSPSFTSRWLGYLSRAESWPEPELSRRWSALRRELDGSAAFLICVSAYPKSSTLDLIESAPANTEDLGWPGKPEEALRVFVEADGVRMEVEAKRLAAYHVRDQTQIIDYRWWLDVRIGGWLTPARMSQRKDPRYALGDYYGVWYYVEAPLVPGMHRGPFSLTVESKNKTRRATWNLGATPLEGREMAVKQADKHANR